MKRFFFIILLVALSFNIYAEGPQIFGGGGSGTGDMTEAVYVDGGYLATDKGGVGVDLSGYTGLIYFTAGSASQLATGANVNTFLSTPTSDNFFSAISDEGAYAPTLFATTDEANFKQAVNLEIGTDIPALATTVEFSTQTDSGLTGASDTITLIAGYKEKHRLLLSSDTDGTAITFAETDSGAAAITDNTHIHFINTGTNTLTFSPSSGVQEGTYAEYEQYDSGECFYTTDRWVCNPLNVTNSFVSTSQAGANVIIDNDGRTIATNEMNSIIVTTGAADYDIPATECDATADFGKWLLLKADAAVAPSITSANASDYFILSDGTETTAADELDLSGTKGGQCCVMCLGVNEWHVIGEIGTCADGGAAD